MDKTLSVHSVNPDQILTCPQSFGSTLTALQETMEDPTESFEIKKGIVLCVGNVFVRIRN